MTHSERMKKQGSYELSFEPKSIWNYKNNALLEEICDTNYKSEQLSKSYEKNWILAGSGSYLSSWNKEYQKRIVEFWTKDGDTILDPFAGHSSSFVPFLMNRNFIGFEVTKKRFDIQIQHLSVLKDKFKRTSSVNLINDSSEYIDKYVNDLEVDCIITDPPFWNLEKYDEPVNGTQLSDLSNKSEFDKMFVNIIQKSVNKVKKGGFIVVKIANFRKNGKFLNLKDEWTEYITSTGVDYVDEIILELSPVKRHPLYNQAITKLNMLKIHEYLIIFRKPIKNIPEENDLINFNRPLVKDTYENEDRLFWAEKRNKKDWVTEKLKRELNKTSENMDDW